MTDINRLKEMRSILRMEIAGIKSKGKTVYSVLRSDFGFKGCRKEMLDQLDDMIEEQKGKR